MKLKITQEFNNVDDDWLDWWIKKFGEPQGIDVENPKFPHTYTEKDPDSESYATTEITLDAPDSERFRTQPIHASDETLENWKKERAIEVERLKNPPKEAVP